jgi:hypothetical protein
MRISKPLHFQEPDSATKGQFNSSKQRFFQRKQPEEQYFEQTNQFLHVSIDSDHNGRTNLSSSRKLPFGVIEQFTQGVYPNGKHRNYAGSPPPAITGRQNIITLHPSFQSSKTHKFEATTNLPNLHRNL